MRAQQLLMFLLAVFSCINLCMLTSIAAEADGPAVTDTEPEDAGNNEMLNYVSSIFQSGEFEEARSIVESMLVDDPDDQNTRALLATILIEQQEYEKAKAIFDALILESPENHMMLNNYAWMLATSKNAAFRDPERALILAQEAILVAPNAYPVWSTLAQAHHVNGNYEKALTVINHCIDLAEKAEAPEETIQKYTVQMRTHRKAATVTRLIE